jgi:ubiquitin carboxyl-terminal hydrolase 4/11/15
MSHVTPLTRLFLSNQFLTCLNENNINGTGGKVANAYATLMKDLWMGGHQHSSLSPTILKRAIELFAPQFYGVQQQDSAEFLSYLLDALHEDLNMIRNPPYVEMPDVDRGRKLTVCGAEVRYSVIVCDALLGIFDENMLTQRVMLSRLGTPCCDATRATSLRTFMECTKVHVSVQSVKQYQLHLVRIILACR